MSGMYLNIYYVVDLLALIALRFKPVNYLNIYSTPCMQSSMPVHSKHDSAAKQNKPKLLCPLRRSKTKMIDTPRKSSHNKRLLSIATLIICITGLKTIVHIHLVQHRIAILSFLLGRKPRISFSTFSFLFPSLPLDFLPLSLLLLLVQLVDVILQVDEIAAQFGDLVGC